MWSTGKKSKLIGQWCIFTNTQLKTKSVHTSDMTFHYVFSIEMRITEKRREATCSFVKTKVVFFEQEFSISIVVLHHLLVNTQLRTWSIMTYQRLQVNLRFFS